MVNVSVFSRQTFGWLAVFGSAFCFYLATAVIRWGKPQVVIDTSYYVFARFLLGFIVVCLTMAIRRQRLVPRSYHYLLGRTIANTIAVFCFYKAVEVSTLAEANILNMTYPLFVALFSWIMLKEQRDIFALFIVLLAFVGIWMILSPSDMNINLGSLWGLCSGITAAVAMIYLNVSRRYHDSQTILFFMFGIGAVAIYLLFHDVIFWPNGTEFFFLFMCSVLGVLGQYLLTYGYFFVTAVEGSIISSSRILLAALLGPLLVGDPGLTLIGWSGAVLIFLANSLLAMRRVRARPLSLKNGYLQG
ncbi:DMT family transporter [Desulfofustis limnaeus]|uniref:DMT family transporter n=1 Tax=Desulfofustis limnaeus TaxID=2740163 RepID=UPI0024DFCFA8|nr:EamA family transporter [Desulfofustis limnaeus]MDX9896423.1 EamA family transporter [Desulfofustis sp.]